MHYEKNGCFAIGFASQFLSCTEHLQLIATQLQLRQNSSFPTTMQLHYNCTHDVILKSLIVIHLLKCNTWHYENFWTLKKKSKYLSPSSIMIINDGMRL